MKIISYIYNVKVRDMTNYEKQDWGFGEIPSEFIEPYLQKMLSLELDCIQYKPTEERLEEAKQNLKGVERFVSRFCGIHARLATSNTYAAFYDLTLEQVKEILDGNKRW